MVVIFVGNDAFWVILWNIFGFRMTCGARIYDDFFGEQMKDHSIGRGTGIIPNLERMTQSNGYPLKNIHSDCNIVEKYESGLSNGIDRY
jgi:hypothetical protein